MHQSQSQTSQNACCSSYVIETARIILTQCMLFLLVATLRTLRGGADDRDNTETAIISLEDDANLRSGVPHQLLRLLRSLAQRPGATLLERSAGSFGSPCSLCLYVFTPSSSLCACCTIFRKPEGSPCRVELRSETIEKNKSPVAIRRCNAGQNSFARLVPTSCSTAAGSGLGAAISALREFSVWRSWPCARGCARDI